MKKISNFILYCCCFSLFLISCAKKENSSSSSTASTMSSQSIADGNYKLTAAIQKVYYSNGTLYGTFTYSISHDSNVTPGYLAYFMKWKGSGVYRITSKGKATLSISGLDDTTIDCTTNAIDDFTLDTDGNKMKETAIQTGCGGSSSSHTEVSQKFTEISGGFQHYGVFEDSDSNQYQITYTFQKQATTSSSDDTSSFSVSEITQINEGDGYLSGSFVVPSNGISFMLATFRDNNAVVAFYSLTDPDGTNILSSSSALYNLLIRKIGRLWICQCFGTTDAQLQCKSWDMDI